MGPQETAVGRRLAAIFAADVAGYSRLMGQDEVGTLRALSAARATLGRFIAEYGGRLVNTVGDSVLAEFPSAIDAVKCAISVQARRAEAEAEAVEGPRLRFRIAVHVGDVIPSGGDIYADGVNVCARLQEVAEPGGICVSGAAFSYVRKALPVAFDDLGERTLKNIEEPVRVFAIRASPAVGHSPPRLKPTAAPPPWQANARPLGWITAATLAAVIIAIFLLYQFAPAPGTTTPQAGSISIAVLPFENLSGDPSQEFFSDGMTEEITTALAKIPNLRVVGRTSAFQFKSQNKDFVAVRQALGVTYLVDGSVRKEGDRVRITAQLVQTDNGVNVWTESYDRQLGGVLAVQEDIAQAIAGALRVPLGLQPGDRLVPDRRIDPESYQQYLHAKALVRTRGVVLGAKPLSDAAALLEQVVARNPDFAGAWALLAQAYNLIPTYEVSQASVSEGRRVVDATLPKAEAAARRAIQLEPKSPDGYSSLALAQAHRGKLLVAEDLLKQSLAIDPNLPDALQQSSLLLGAVGLPKEALAMMQRLQAVEPLVPAFNSNTVLLLWLNGKNDAAIAMAKNLPTEIRGFYLAMIYASIGRYSEAADAFPQTPIAEEAAKLLRTAPATAASPPSLAPVPLIDFVYLHVGVPNRSLDFYEMSAEVPYFIVSYNAQLWHPSYAPARKTERFKVFMRKAGMVEYWRTRGWPDLCRPMGADDFVCD